MATTDDIEKIRQDIIRQRDKIRMRQQVEMGRRHARDESTKMGYGPTDERVTKTLAYTDEKMKGNDLAKYENIKYALFSLDNYELELNNTQQQAIQRRALRYAKAAQKDKCYDDAIKFLDIAKRMINKTKP